MMSGSSLSAQTKEANKMLTFTVDAAQSLGSFKPLNGVNGGPRIRMGGCYDNSEYFELFKPPFIRLHDTPYADKGTVDIHEIFPDFDADENDPSNYQFEKTDLHLKPIIKLGSGIIFRLGESLEHSDQKYYVHPPADFKKWARICSNIVRHYNMGWANGYKWNIQHWEIWNEPDILSCWTGTIEQYCEMYKETATLLKKLDPGLKVGGPALSHSLDSEKGRKFLDFCRNNTVPLDFISWHIYASHPDITMKRIETGMATIKEYGFQDVETYITEWNMVISWSRKDREKTREMFSKITGGPGAAFVASVLAYMQDSELDLACYYAAFGSVFRFGLFDIYGVPKKPLYTFEAFNHLVKCGTRIAVSGNHRETGVGIIAAVNKETGTTAVLLSNFDNNVSRFNLEMKHLPFDGQLFCSEYVIDDERTLEWDREQVLSSGDFRIVVELPKASVRLILINNEMKNQ